MLKKYVIEREVAGIGTQDDPGYRAIARQSCATLNRLGSDIQWVESFVVDDKTYCVYLARDEDIIREHALQSGFPANRIAEVRRVLDPTQATG